MTMIVADKGNCINFSKPFVVKGITEENELCLSYTKWNKLKLKQIVCKLFTEIKFFYKRL